jgi:hypothetical protein
MGALSQSCGHDNQPERQCSVLLAFHDLITLNFGMDQDILVELDHLIQRDLFESGCISLRGTLNSLGML